MPEEPKKTMFLKKGSWEECFYENEDISGNYDSLNTNIIKDKKTEPDILDLETANQQNR